MADNVGIRELRDHLSAVVRRVKGGEVFTVTEHGRPVAVLVPTEGLAPREILEELARLGRISRDGGKPAGATQPPLVRGPAVAEVVLGGRR